MKELILGKGFIGTAYTEHARAEGHDVHIASRRPNGGTDEHFVDLNQPHTINKVLDEVQPNVIINAAAILGRNPGDQVEQNPFMTRNVLESARLSGLNLSRIVILGSSAEYGPVESHELPIHEDAILNPDTAYGRSKRDEVNVALNYANRHGMPVVVGRIFSSLGLGLHPSNLTSRVLDQIREQRGRQDPTIEVRNLEASRDYINVRDTIRAMGILAHTESLPYRVFNIASGSRTANKEVIRAALQASGDMNMRVIATDNIPEQLTGASHADISRLKELGYQPNYTIAQTVAEMVAEVSLAPDVHKAA